jgi:signal transduction histidine kinase
VSLHDRERLEARLRSVADPTGFLINLFAHAPVGFAVWSADGTPLLTNAAFLALFGSEPPPGYNVLEDNVLRENGMLALFERAFAGETVHVPTFWFDPRDITTVKITEGRRVAISMTIFPLFKPTGEVDYVAATYKDETEIRTLADKLTVSEERAKDWAEAANVELEAFSYSVAHDLRAPLRAMAGFANVLREDYGDKLDADAHGHLDRISTNAVRMGHLIDGLLSLSRIAKHELVRSTIELGKLARDVIRQLGEPKVIEWQIEDGMIVRADPVLMRSVMQHLLANAIKFTSERERARIEIGRTESDGVPAYFVRDNGAGFDMAHVSQLFQPFKRLHTTAGAGIGLAMVQRVIRRHGGKIWAEGAPGQGATFYFTL